ncbi:MAG: DUF305 domain-containing protein [Candidatus Atribacteria bacterium]|nr:DUF305 domain-containing protein [Candidatus Atribacteria bacterium]
MERFRFSVGMLLVMVAVLICIPPGVAKAHMVHGQTPMDHGVMKEEKENGQDLEQLFLSMMIPHHRGAVEMSRYILGVAHDERVIAWAKAIIAAQEREMALMERWLSERGGADEKTWQAMEAEMAEMMDLLRGAEDSERAFVEHMIPHHLEAVGAALAVLEKTKDRDLLLLARDIITTQVEEVVQFRIWLLGRDTHSEH